MIENWVRPDYHLKVTQLKPRDEGRGKRAIRAALRFDPLKHPLARRAGIAIHLLRGRPVIFRTHMLVNGGITLQGDRNNQTWMLESSLTRSVGALLTLDSMEGMTVETVHFDGAGSGVGVMLK